MSMRDLPNLNALLNLSTTILLTLGYYAIKKGQKATHKKYMIFSLVLSACFLCSYTIYHYNIGSIPYPHFDWTRPLYFIILVPHILFAALMTPFILAAVWFALKDNFEKHIRIVKWIWPVWMFVSVSGVVIYLMLYRL
jgi:putative membrane protein